MGRLKSHHRVYMAGPMDREPDGGEDWRFKIGNKLKEKYGITIYSPTYKPTDHGCEDKERRAQRQQWKKEGQWHRLAEHRDIRIIDLSMVDKSDFLIVNLDMSCLPCGTFEECFWSNRLKRPVLVVSEAGLDKIPDWLWWTLPYEFFFDSWDKLFEYLDRVNDGEPVSERWVLFDF